MPNVSVMSKLAKGIGYQQSRGLSLCLEYLYIYITLRKTVDVSRCLQSFKRVVPSEHRVTPLPLLRREVFENGLMDVSMV